MPTELVGFAELLEQAHRMDLIAALLPPSLTFHYLPSKDVAIPTDRGLILDRRTWAKLRGQVDAFFAIYSDDAIEVVNSRARLSEARPEMAIDLAAARAAGHIYLVRSKDGLYHFGICTNLREKLKRIKEAAKQPVEVVHSWRVLDMRRTEARLAEQFAAKRHRQTAWYRLSPEDVAYLQGLRDERAVADERPAGGVTEEDLRGGVDEATRLRVQRYWDTLKGHVRVIKRAAEQGSAINRIMRDVDREGWRDDDAFDCMAYQKQHGRGEVSWMNTENYLPTYMARRDNDVGTEAAARGSTGRRGPQPAGRPDDAAGKPQGAGLKVTRKEGV